VDIAVISMIKVDTSALNLVEEYKLDENRF